MLILNGLEVRRALPMHQAINAVKRAFACLSDGKVEMPLRSRLPIAPHQAVSLFMPAYIQNEEEALAVKIVSVFPHNPSRGLPLIFAVVFVLEADTGKPLAILEGSTLTAIRTGAASGVATDILARPNSQTLAIIGAGVQGRTQLEAVCAVRHIRTVWVFDIDTEKATHFQAETISQHITEADIKVASTAQEAVAEADIICTATTANSPVFSDQDIKLGVHINGVGSYTPEMQEIPAETVARALVVVDSYDASLAEAGDLLIPIRRGIITNEHIHGELGEVILGHKHGRTSNDQITFFKSVGVAAQDAATAQLAYKNAQVMGIGQNVMW